MNRLCVFFIVVLLGARVIGQAQQPANAPTPTPYTIISRDANSQVWERTTYDVSPSGKIIPHSHHYTELGTGLCYQQNGQWVDSQELINIQPDGTASATNGQHQVYFPPDIGNGIIKLVTSDGLQLQSQPLGLFYDDGSNTVIFAELTNSVGQLISPNQVIYTNAFIGVDADLLYTYRKSGFEQDVVFREQPPAPEQFGFSSANTRIQLMTEFFNTPNPIETVNPVNSQDGLQDTTLSFGAMKMTHGRAFMASLLRTANNLHEIPVYKNWTTFDGREFLIEQVPYQRLASQLSTLPTSEINGVSSRNSILNRVSAKRLLPPVRLAEATTNAIQLAKNNPIQKPGVVLDYFIENANLLNFTFQGDTTYFITNSIGIAYSIFEGGTVIKFSDSGNLSIDYNGTADFETGPYRPAIFTSMDDDSVGERISGSTGSPTFQQDVYNLFISIFHCNIHDCRFNYGGIGIYQPFTSGATLNITNCQFMNEAAAAQGANVGLYNVLIGDTPTIAAQITNSDDVGAAQIYVESTNFVAENVTADNGYAFIEADNASATLALTNCLVTRQPLLSPYGYTLTPLSNAVVSLPSSSTQIYQTVGAGGYYLTNGSPYQGKGTAIIDSNLLAELAQKTTYPPTVFSNIAIYVTSNFCPQVPRDTNASPDIGYHYDPLDYVFGDNVTLYSNATVSAGTAMGWFEDINSETAALTVDQMDINGTATSPCWFVRYNTVQEGGSGNWTANSQPGDGNVNGGLTVWGPLTAHFTKWTTFGVIDYPLEGWENPNSQVSLVDCEIYNGQVITVDDSLYFTNCLLSRSAMSFNGYDQVNANFTLENCTFLGGSIGYGRTSFNPPSYWIIQNSAFDGTSLLSGDDYSSNTNYAFMDYNAFLTNADRLPVLGSHDVIVTNINGFNWQSSWFGDYYLPTNSPLVKAGSTTADHVGLYDFTMQTNQTPEGTNLVDIGYHYVATDSYGNPLETYIGGIPNYIVDSQGTGMDTNGLPYWWEGEYFGEVGLNPSSDPDNDGNNLLYDYTNDIDPNIIQFSVLLTNQYVINTNALIPIIIGAGEPFFYSILIDSTNFSEAIWNAFTSSNLTCNFSSLQGWHNVEVGLRGRPTVATQTWQWQHLDFVSSPLLVVTSPTSIVDQPIIQIYGYAQEQLANITYDISNAFGVLTNQTADITDQYFDTNAFGITTNYFDCLDVQVTNGLNIVTMHATDMAGDTTISNFDFTLDYSSKTNPPALQITWPQSGTEISGTNFTSSGWISDPTATVTAFFILTNGDTNVFLNGIYTNTYFGEVGRDGSFSFEDLPLNPGTNNFTIVATDVVGNTIATNISVLQTNFVLTINPVSPDSQLWQPTVNLTGTISDSTYAVWVNGVKGTNNGNGTWSANNVPVSNAVFTATGYAPSEQQPDGSYGN